MTDEQGAPDALLLMTAGCPHCPAALQSLTALLKEAAIGRLEIINVAIHTDEAEKRGVQSVPWAQIGPFEIEGVMNPARLRELALGVHDNAVFDAWVLDLLKSGKRQKFESLIQRDPQRIHALARLMENPETSMAIRLGIGAVLEELQGSGVTEALVPKLGKLLQSQDALLATDAAHFLTLIGGQIIHPWMQAAETHSNSDIREIAAEWLAENGNQ